MVDYMRVRHVHAKDFSGSFKSYRVDLLTPYPTLTHPSFQYSHPSLFELQATIEMHSLSLKRIASKHTRPQLPPYPTEGPPEAPLTTTILRAVQDVKLELPVYWGDIDFPFEESESSAPAAAILVDWIESVLQVLKELVAFQDLEIPDDYLLVVIRALAYLESVNQGNRDRHSKLHYSLYSHCIYRYSYGVLENIASDLISQTAKRGPMIRGLAKSIHQLLKSWNQYAKDRLPKILDSGVSYFRIILFSF
jgi:hypothetical protein